MAEWQNGRTAELRRMVRCKTHGTHSRWSWRVKVLGRQNAQQERQSRSERASEQERGDGKRQNAVWTGSDRTGVRLVAHERSTTSEEQHVAVRALLLFSETENENGATGACLSVCPSVRLFVDLVRAGLPDHPKDERCRAVPAHSERRNAFVECRRRFVEIAPNECGSVGGRGGGSEQNSLPIEEYERSRGQCHHATRQRDYQQDAALHCGTAARPRGQQQSTVCTTLFSQLTINRRIAINRLYDFNIILFCYYINCTLYALWHECILNKYVTQVKNKYIFNSNFKITITKITDE